MSISVQWRVLKSTLFGGIFGGEKLDGKWKFPQMPLNDSLCKSAKPSDKPRKIADDRDLFWLVAVSVQNTGV